MNDELIQKLDTNNRLLMALLSLWVMNYTPGANEPRAEVLLASKGLSYQEIASVLGKKPDAVRMLLKRQKNIQ